MIDTSRIGNDKTLIICETALDSYYNVLISEMDLNTSIVVEAQDKNDLYPLIRIMRTQNQEWEGSIFFYYKDLPSDEFLSSQFKRLQEICPNYKSLLLTPQKELQIIIDSDMSICDAVEQIYLSLDFFYNELIHNDISHCGQLLGGYIITKLPIYQRAMAQVKMELENFSSDDQDIKTNVVDICGRVKSIESIKEKITRKQINKFDVFKLFDDIAGVRCTCEYLDDVYNILDYIKNNPLLTVIEIDDKIEKGTADGYRGIHITVSTHIYYKNTLFDDIKVEIQLRTAFQNAWSMKTHQLTYKQDSECKDEVRQKMKHLSDILYEADKVSLEMKEKILTSTQNQGFSTQLLPTFQSEQTALDSFIKFKKP